VIAVVVKEAAEWQTW